MMFHSSCHDVLEGPWFSGELILRYSKSLLLGHSFQFEATNPELSHPNPVLYCALIAIDTPRFFFLTQCTLFVLFVYSFLKLTNGYKGQNVKEGWVKALLSVAST